MKISEITELYETKSNELDDFLYEHTTKNSRKANLLSLNNGMWEIPDTSYETFLKLYSKYYTERRYFLVERRGALSPFTIDLDYDVQYSEEVVIQHIFDLIEIMKEHDNTKDKMDGEVCFQMSTSKDRMHVVFTKVQLSQRDTYELNAHLIETMTRKYHTFSWGKILDSSMGHNGLRMLGSFKPNGGDKTYKPVTIDFHKRTVTEKDITYKWLKSNSVWYNSDGDVITSKYVPPKNNGDIQYETIPKLDKGITIEILRKIVLEGLSDHRSVDYESWRDVIWCIQNVVNEHKLDHHQGKMIAQEFSQKCMDKYDDDYVSSLYDNAQKSYKINKLKLGSLYYWLKLDNKQMFDELKSTPADNNSMALVARNVAYKIDHHELSNIFQLGNNVKWACQSLPKGIKCIPCNNKRCLFNIGIDHNDVDLSYLILQSKKTNIVCMSCGKRTVDNADHDIINTLVSIIRKSEETQQKDIRRDDEELIQLLAKNNIFEDIICDSNKDGWYYMYNNDTGLWEVTTKKYVSSIVRRRIKSLDKELLTKEESFYLGNVCSSTIVVDGALLHMQDKEIENKLDNIKNSIAFANGVYKLDTHVFEPHKKENYVSSTIKYPFDLESINENDVSYINMLYEQWFPNDTERELFLRLVSTSLSGALKLKKCIVLTDERAGDNGKSMCIQFLRETFDIYFAPSKNDFVYASKNTADINSHGAGLLGYKNKRLAIFDELDANKPLDVPKLKELSGGGATCTARAINSGKLITFEWSSFFVLACNECNFPKFNSCDEAFLNRLVIFPMRSKFVKNQKDVDASSFTYLIDENIRDKCRSLTSAHMFVLVEAYKRFQSHGLGELPVSMAAIRRNLIQGSDNTLDMLIDFLNDNVEKADNEMMHAIILSDIKARIRNHGINISTLKRNEFIKLITKAMSQVFTDIKFIEGTFKIKNESGSWIGKRCGWKGIKWIRGSTMQYNIDDIDD